MGGKNIAVIHHEIKKQTPPPHEVQWHQVKPVNNKTLFIEKMGITIL